MTSPFRYHDFHGLQIKTAKEYPLLIKNEVKGYESSICDYFQASRMSKAKLKKVEEAGEGRVPGKFNWILF